MGAFMAATQNEITSKGRVTAVAASELDDLRSQNLGWYSYCQARLTRNHTSAVQHLTRFRP
jgi:hypothetical protein